MKYRELHIVGFLFLLIMFIAGTPTLLMYILIGTTFEISYEIMASYYIGCLMALLLVGYAMLLENK